MALDDVIRSVVAIGKSIAQPVMVDVQHVMFIGRDQWGTLYADPVTRQALVEDVGEAVVDEDGNSRQSTSKLSFLEAIPVTMSDRFIVGGEESGVAKRSGLKQPDGVMTYTTEVWLGHRPR